MLAAFSTTGCTKLWGPKTPPIDKQAPVISQTPTANDLVSYLNREATKLHTLESDDLYIKVKGEGAGMVPGMKGNLLCESPRNFRLTGSVAAMSQVDFGSNKDLFWFWIRQDPSNSMYYCKYSDFNQGVRLPFPFQPEWVLQALGMAQYDPKKEYRVEIKPDVFELIENTTVQGQAVKKTTVFSRRQLAKGEPQIKAHIVQDAKTGAVITSAEVKRVMYAGVRTADGQNVWVTYPHMIVMDWPSEKISMELTLRDVTVNKQLEPDVFTMIQLPNVQKVNLAQAARTGPASRSVEQAGGTSYRNP
jgi:hypothetical protein